MKIRFAHSTQRDLGSSTRSSRSWWQGRRARPGGSFTGVRPGPGRAAAGTARRRSQAARASMCRPRCCATRASIKPPLRAGSGTCRVTRRIWRRSPNADYDGVVCHLALMDIPRLAAAVEESVARVLRAQGWLVFSIVPPLLSARVNVADYLRDHRYRKTNPAKLAPQYVHRPLAMYVDELRSVPAPDRAHRRGAPSGGNRRWRSRSACARIPSGTDAGSPRGQRSSCRGSRRVPPCRRVPSRGASAKARSAS